MRRALVISYGLDDVAAGRLQARLRGHGLELRATRHAKACVNVLRQGAAGVLLLRVGKDLDLEFALLAQASLQFPGVAPVVWGDADHPQLAGLAYDLGAQAVFLPLEDESRLHDVILRLLAE